MLYLKNIAVTMWDVGGQGMMREHWKDYYQNAAAIVFVVDASDLRRMEEARSELEKTLRDDHLRGCPLMLLANKQDVRGALTVTDMKDKFNMRKMCVGREWFVQPCSASTGFGVEEAFKRLVQMVKLPSEPGAVKDNIKDSVHYLRSNSKQ
uniref:ADP-ribosylation factor-like 14 n=1 Tax=Cyprinodon variegatus TaxID=28743 RepID=A0A3Q2FP28_CYPVA